MVAAMLRRNCFYISGMTEDASGGIFRCRWDGTPRILDRTPLERNLFLTWGGDGRTLYAAARDRGRGAVAAFRVAPDGELTLLNMLPAGGDSACYLTVSPDGKFLYSANYASGNWSEFPLAPDGALAKLNRVVDCRKDARAPSHPHCCVFTPDGKFLCVVDLGLDRIFLHAFDAGRGVSPDATEAVALETGFGPRHLCFDAAGQNAYLLGESSGEIQRFRYENGRFIPGCRVSALSAPGKVVGEAAAIRLSRNGKFLFASNRGDDSIAVFSVNASGELTLKTHVPSLGKSPRDFFFLPGCGIMAVANEFSDEVVFFACDQNSGEIGVPLGKLALPRPLYLLA